MGNQNYYEVLGVSLSATVAEIEMVVEEHYNKWRRLVTHHDPNVVTQANQALQSLEQIRTTLTVSDKRAVYDAGVELSGAIGGLSDPGVASRQAGRSATPPPSLPVSRPRPDVGERVDAWVCSKCRAANAVGTRFCRKCGQQVGRDCPKCGQRIDANSAHCSECGVDVNEFIQRKRRAEQEVQRIVGEISAIVNRIRQLESGLKPVPEVYAVSEPHGGIRMVGICLAICGFGLFLVCSMGGNLVGAICGVILFLSSVLPIWIYRGLNARRKAKWRADGAYNERINQQILRLRTAVTHLQDEMKQWRTNLGN